MPVWDGMGENTGGPNVLANAAVVRTDPDIAVGGRQQGRHDVVGQSLLAAQVLDMFFPA